MLCRCFVLVVQLFAGRILGNSFHDDGLADVKCEIVLGVCCGRACMCSDRVLCCWLFWGDMFWGEDASQGQCSCITGGFTPATAGECTVPV